jgi:hypothetical protein
MVAEKIFDSPEARYILRVSHARAKILKWHWVADQVRSPRPNLTRCTAFAKQSINCEPALERDLVTNSLTTGHD